MLDSLCSCWPRLRATTLFGVLCALSVLSLVALDLSVAEAQRTSGNNRLAFTVAVDSLDDDFGVDEDGNIDSSLRVRKHREVANEAARRIEKRLDTTGVKSHEVRVNNDHNIEIVVYGAHSPAAIKGAIIPPGRLEIRPVVVDDSPWLDVEEPFPPGVEVRIEPGALRFDQVFLFASSPAPLRQIIRRHGPDDRDITVFPVDDGWRTIHLGGQAADHGDLHSATISQTPAGAPFVSLEFQANAAQNIRAAAAAAGARHLAVVVDGEIVALHAYNHRRRTSGLSLDPPDHLHSLQAQGDWAIQVAGRLAAHIPIRLAEIQE